MTRPRRGSGCRNGPRMACWRAQPRPASSCRRWDCTRSPPRCGAPRRCDPSGPGLRRRSVDVAAFDYALPEELIAQAPLAERDASRLLVLPRQDGAVQHRAVRDLPEVLRPGDLLVANDARVIPARLHGHKQGTGGKVELLLGGAGGRVHLLLGEPLGGPDWLALGQASKPLRGGQKVDVLGSEVEIVQVRQGRELVGRLTGGGGAPP